MIIKLAQFESEVTEMEKEGAFRTGTALWNSLPADARKVLQAAGYDSKTVGKYGRGRLTAAGGGGGKALDAILGGDVSGYLGQKTQNAAHYAAKYKPALGGAALLGGGAYAYKRSKDK